MKSPATTAEEGLIREKAAGMTLLELQQEIQRCEYGIRVAANEAARKRFERRAVIMREAVAKLGAAVSSGGAQ